VHDVGHRGQAPHSSLPAWPPPLQVIRGSKRYLFDFRVTAEWVVEFPASGEGGSKKLKG
jgi:hypothetical protein